MFKSSFIVYLTPIINPVNNETMKKTALNLCSIAFLCLPSYGQKDITSTYLANPSFEEDAAACTLNSPNIVNEGNEGLRGWNLSPSGWQMTSPGKALLINKECATDNNFGKTDMADGSFAFYQRFGWGSAASELRQTTSAPLPAGEYEIRFFSKAFCANNAATSAVVTVTNEGLEIPEKELTNIFEKFYRLDTARSTRTGGAGLGLAIAKEIVELHGGSIRAECTGVRTAFVITLPLQ